MSNKFAQFLTGGTQYVSKVDFSRPAGSQIYMFIRDAIVSMQLEPGQLISETALASYFKVSRTPVREALIKLANLGFVEVRPQRGTYVSKLSREAILEARFIREALEVSVVSYLVDHIEQQLLIDAEAIIAKQEEAAKLNNPILFQSLDDEFHQLLSKNTGYARVSNMIEQEKAHMDRLRNLSLHMSGQYARVISQHRAILSALDAGNREVAVAAMAHHLREVNQVLERLPIEHPEYFI